MDFLFKILETILVFDVRINLCIAFVLWAIAALLTGLAIEFVFFIGKKIMAAKRFRRLRNKERVLFKNNMKGVKSNG